MKELIFQQKAVRKLVDETIELLRLSGHRKTLIFKAPTGAGKTVMASQMLADLTEELQSRGDSPYPQVAFIWIAPNKHPSWRDTVCELGEHQQREERYGARL